MNETITTGLKWGALGGIVTSLLGLIFYILNVESSTIVQLMNLAILIAIIILGSYEFRDKVKNGFTNFRALLGHSMIISFVFAVFSAIWAFIFMEIINPELIKEVLLQSEESMLAQGLDEAQIKQSLEVTKMMMRPYIFPFVLILQVSFFGFLIAIPTCIILRKEKPESVLVDEKLNEE